MNLPVIAPPVFGPTQASNIRAPSNLGQNIWGAVEQFGGAIGHVSEQAQQIQQKVQAADDAAGLMQIDALSQSAAAEHENYTRTNSDVSTYQANADQVWARAKSAMDPIYERLSPAAVKHGEAMTEVNGMIFDRKAQHLATTQTVNNAIGVFNAGMEKAAIEMNPDAAQGTMDIAIRAGIKSKEEGAKQLEVTLNKIDANRFAFAIKNDLWNPDIATNYKLSAKAGGHLSESQLTDLIRDQQIQQGFTRSQTQKALDTYREIPTNDPAAQIPGFTMKGPDGKLKGMTIDEIAEQQHIDGKWVARWKKQVPLDDQQTITAILSALDKVKAGDYDQSTQTGRENLAGVYSYIGQSGLTTSMKDRMFTILNKNIAGGVKAEESNEKAAYSIAADVFHKGGTIPYVITPHHVEVGNVWDTDVPEQTKFDLLNDPIKISAWETGTEISESVKATARDNYMQLRDVIAGVTASKPNATNKDYSDAINAFLKPLNEAKVADALSKPVATPPPSGMVRVRTKEGKVGTIPAAKLPEALKKGYTKVE